MKLRRAMVTAAATAVIAPLALLSAPAVFADDGGTATASTSSPAAAESSPAADQSSPAADESSPAADESSPAADESSPAADESSPAAGESSPADSGSPTPSAAPSKPSDWTPDQCDAFSLDQNLKVAVDGLPSKIVAGSGWHDFTFSVQNNSDTDLKNVWVDTFTEYDDNVNVNDSLAYELAQLQYKDPQTGKWTDSYQDSDGGDVVPGTFVGVIDAIDKGAKVDMDLRVRVSSKAPAGSSFAMSSAIYAGKGTSCNGNGDSYEFTVLKAGSTTPAGTGDAKPTGDKPTGKPKSDMTPQGGSEQLPVTGSLAHTGSSSALPVIGLVGGGAVVVGAGAMFVVRRRKGAGANAAA
ncbi:hypothetical protein [Streptomyces sp. NPDC048385]|uniref:hypothetical protein n=1 Tax=unclassified Streptomyces TaxID=2593676 RepID=UPI00341D04B9